MKIKSFEEFRRMVERKEDVAFRSSLGFFSIQKESNFWLVRDLGSAPDDVVCRFKSPDDLFANFQYNGQRLQDLWRSFDVVIDDEA